MFKQRKNRKFNYKPRFQDSHEKMVKEDFESKWNAAKPSSKRRISFFSSLSTMLVFLIAVIVLMYILNGYIK